MEQTLETKEEQGNENLPMRAAEIAVIEQVRAIEAQPSGKTIAEGAPDGTKAFKYSLPELKKIAEVLYSGGLFKDLKSVPATMTKILAGAELGYGPFQSMRAFHIIEGRPTETAAEITARIQRSGKYKLRSYFIIEGGDKHDPIRMKSSEVYGSVVIVSVKEGRKWVDYEPSVFTRDDAKEAGLASKQVWRSYFRNMAFARALTNAARYHCADLFGGPIYTPEELGANVDFDADGEMQIANTALPPAASDAPDRTVDTDQTRAQGVAHVTRYASNRKISDAHRHEIAQAFFGKASSKELTTAELRKLYELLLGYVKQRDAVTGENLAWDEDAFNGWLGMQIEASKAAAAEEPAADAS